MKMMIASDVHGSDTYLSQLMGAFDREEPQRLLLLGDILYHGPRNDLPDGYAPKQALTRLNAIADRLLCVRGNCDSEVDQTVLDFPILAEYALLYLDRRLVFLTHGHVWGPDQLPKLKPGDVLLSGHTHVPIWEDRAGILCLNPGSVSIPKQGSQRGYMTLTDEVFAWKTLDGEQYHELEL